ncbi:hypothetical protein ODJ79_04105 [Actinoplanes sp. KI2]|uniref:hypothetical protein n=1 Tax=Actinoplanes sp. KI2 TaxID=2983315 RepID=UPI0021D56A20|nr:hypothetical protein [Actinoplanes sp. KI2]MCU7722889.1 hypothetical protein [Actinoplanes sp. KI2]
MLVGAAVGRPYAPGVGWSVAALGYVPYTSLIVGSMSARATATHADPGRRATDLTGAPHGRATPTPVQSDGPRQ